MKNMRKRFGCPSGNDFAYLIHSIAEELSRTCLCGFKAHFYEASRVHSAQQKNQISGIGFSCSLGTRFLDSFDQRLASKTSNFLLGINVYVFPEAEVVISLVLPHQL